MDMLQRQYYRAMAARDRLIAIRIGDNLSAVITFYIGYAGSEDKYVRDNPWSVLEDEPNGNVCFIDQLITDKHPDNIKYSLLIWHHIQDMIRDGYPTVEYIRWNRYKGGKVYVYYKSIK